MNPLHWMVGHRDDGRLLPDDAQFQRIGETIASSIVAENNHVQNRVQWNLALQGFLFASYALAIGREVDRKLAEQFIEVIVWVGKAASLVTLLGLYAAFHAMNSCKRLWLTNESKLSKYSARPFSDPLPSFLGRLPATLIVVMLLVAWFRLSSIPAS